MEKDFFEIFKSIIQGTLNGESIGTLFLVIAISLGGILLKLILVKRNQTKEAQNYQDAISSSKPLSSKDIVRIKKMKG
ncbi:MAG: hypothetical protein IT249_19505 [Chitinophagaceae bacterium]|nr:hypothetical protein [Chitinophagaceae bacterium]